MTETGQNYFNYFTEIEEQFQRQRGAQVFLSPVDWALVETWRQAGVPLPAALAGIEQAFAKFARGRRRDSARPRSLLYCAPAVMQAAESWQAAAAGGRTADSAAAVSDELSPARLGESCERWRRAVEAAALPPGLETTQAEAVAALAGWRDALAAAAEPTAAPPDSPAASGLAATSAARPQASATEPPAASTQPSNRAVPGSLEELERHLTALEDKLAAGCQQHAPAEALAEIRAELDRALAPYRRRLTAVQLAAMEPQFLRQRLLDYFHLPRLSLFHLP